MCVLQEKARRIVCDMPDQRSITVVEWAEVVDSVLPEKRITLRITPSRMSETSRDVELLFDTKAMPHLILEEK